MDAVYVMLSARLDESETGGIPPKDERLLVAGDKVTTVFLALNMESGDTTQFDYKTFTIRKGSSFGELELEDGYYAFMYLMTDYKDNYYYSEPLMIEIEDGDASFIKL